MVFYKIKLNFTTPDPKHYLNFVIANRIKIHHSINNARLCKLDDTLQTKKLDKIYLIGTRFLLKNHKTFSIILDSLEGVKFKYLVRKYMKENWRVRVKDITVKHINNIGNNHNYLVLVKKCNKNLNKIKNKINSVDPIIWRSYYEMYKPLTIRDLNIKSIYTHLEIQEGTNICNINSNGINIKINEIYKTISKII